MILIGALLISGAIGIPKISKFLVSGLKMPKAQSPRLSIPVLNTFWHLIGRHLDLSRINGTFRTFGEILLKILRGEQSGRRLFIIPLAKIRQANFRRAFLNPAADHASVVRINLVHFPGPLQLPKVKKQLTPLLCNCKVTKKVHLPVRGGLI